MLSRKPKPVTVWLRSFLTNEASQTSNSRGEKVDYHPLLKHKRNRMNGLRAGREGSWLTDRRQADLTDWTVRQLPLESFQPALYLYSIPSWKKLFDNILIWVKYPIWGESGTVLAWKRLSSLPGWLLAWLQKRGNSYQTRERWFSNKGKKGMTIYKETGLHRHPEGKERD